MNRFQCFLVIMKAETLLFLKRSFPVSFELTTDTKTKVENKNPALVAEPIPLSTHKKRILALEN